MNDSIKFWLDVANIFANAFSGCRKVHVGSAIVDEKSQRIISLGTNRTYPFSCKNIGCLREQLYGDNSKTHRNPGDCRAIHSEVDAILKAKTDVTNMSIFVTRYPCEACARAIVDAGISRVYYGRAQSISDETAKIFYAYDVEVIHVSDWEEEDVVE